MENTKNFIFNSDAYKWAHYSMYPEGTEYLYSYFEARNGARWPATKFFGLQYTLMEYFVGQVVTEAMVDEAEEFAASFFMGVPNTFNREGWMHIVNEHGGRLPIEIKAVPEGSVVDNSNVLLTVENTDPKVPWLTNFVETALSRIWYASTVATYSMAVRSLVEEAWDKTSDQGRDAFGINFCLHDFGSRGVSSSESGAIGGSAHLLNFMGTDTVHAVRNAMKYYDAPMTPGNFIACSVPATEHSIGTILGKKGEGDVFANLLEQFPAGVLSVVIDSYDDDEFTTTLVEKFKSQIVNRDGKVVFRPDSGDPVETTLRIIRNLESVFGHTVNDKGFKLLPPYLGVIYGDGIKLDDIQNIFEAMADGGWSAENVVFGMGGGLLQEQGRDTQCFAFKASATCRNSKWYDVFKEPKSTKFNKASKRGKLKLVRRDGEYFTVPQYLTEKDELQTVFRDGELLIHQTWEEITNR